MTTLDEHPQRHDSVSGLASAKAFGKSVRSANYNDAGGMIFCFACLRFTCFHGLGFWYVVSETSIDSSTGNVVAAPD